jgi:hypothetical protein
MSITEDSLSPALRSGRWLLKVSDVAALYRLPIYIACSVLALAINYGLGKDLAWDTFDYHLYAGFSAFNDRFAQDYFAAGPQSYLNPYGYAPFYALTRSGLSALEIGALLAVWHSVILWLTFELAVAVCPFADRRTRATIGVWAVVLALVNPILLQQIGSSFIDITTAELALAGWVLLATVVRVPRAAPLICAAALLGAATALKLTNAVHAIAGAAVLIMLPLPLRGRLRYGLTYVVVLGLAFTIVTTPWSYRLAKTFGNPFFPQLNNIFRSPEFTTEPLRLFRFIPSNICEALWRPFAMVDPWPMVHHELVAPDARYALLAILVCALLVRWLWRHFARSPSPVDTKPAAEARIVAALGCGFAVDWTLWLVASGNSRYFLPMACVGAVLIVALLPSLVGARPKTWMPVLIAVSAIQIFQFWMNPGLRWNAVPWDSGPWFKVEVPEKLATEPNLYLTMGAKSSSYLAPYVAKGAGFINFTGAYALGATGANGERAEALIHRYAPHLRFLAEGARLYADLTHLPNVSDVDGALARFGLRADASDCTTITVANSKPEEKRPPYTTYLVSCRAVPDTTERSAQTARQQAVDPVLDRLEDACPDLFQPRRPLTEYRNHRWQRVYLNTDITAWVSRGWVKFYNPVSADGPIFLGPESDWVEAPLRVACGRRNGHDFARVLAKNAH